jgi:uncharacterized damage-inducible protein DinB
MTLGITLDQLLDYSDHERRKWREWVSADPARLDVVMQPGGRFPTVGALLDHVFLVERRHLARLEGGTPPDATGVPPGDWKRLFDYADLVRADLRRYASDVDNNVGDQVIAFNAVGLGPVSMTRRRLLTHVVLHEIRHLAQVALAARMAGIAPPGEHDLFYFAEFA